jgi:membrane protease YdiL (CAAX protease family)
MRIREVSWSSVGLSLPSRWPRVVSIGTVGGVAIQALTSLVIDPLMKWAGLAAPTVDGVTNLASSGVVGLALTLLLVWFVGGFLEELCFRGYLMTRANDVFRGRAGTAMSVVLSTAYFGLSHWYQGPSGVIEASVTGLCFGLAFASTRNLLLPIVLHAALDTSGVVMLAAGFTGW